MNTENLLSPATVSHQEEIERLQGMVKTLEGELENIRAGNRGNEKAAEGSRGEKNVLNNVKKLMRGLEPGIKRHEFVVTGLARMFMKLYEHKEPGIEPNLLFGYTGVKRKTGYKYVSLLKGKRYVAFIGARQKGKYILTDIGRKVNEGMVD